MSTDATAHSNATNTSAQVAPTQSASPDKGKGKGKSVPADTMDEDEDDDEDDEEEDEGDEDDDMVEEDELEGIDPTAIRPRRTRGVRVDYASAEALKKAGLKPEVADEDEAEESFEVRDEDMHED
ncbi:hypothetical protein BKA93DRAFT_811469 [Sparassis latifolia]|uniref:Histone H2A.Z-specific chaperone CHZ1 n=1 Tax=Sparassis crispa TaxID=139825 RepID=A0A401GEK8_9APHY|nr:Histone H2A.Z-specific chaperone CHZ1 [Sparassis crispa]GBE80597.1 Histone H2A.Z-specific chaperone CHZ1 [Sparassis crispa]